MYDERFDHVEKTDLLLHQFISYYIYIYTHFPGEKNTNSTEEHVLFFTCTRHLQV